MTNHTDDAATEDILENLFEDLLTTGTVRRRRLSIYFNQGALAELDALEEELENVPDGPETIDTTSRLARIRREAAEIFERYQASKVTFTLVPVDSDTTKEIWEEFPNPPAPHNPLKDRWPIGKNGADRQRIIEQRKAAEKDFSERLEQWRKDVDAQELKRVLRFLAASIEKVESAKGVRPGMSVEELETIRSAPYGVERINDLWSKFEQVSKSRGEVAPPLLLEDCGSETE